MDFGIIEPCDGKLSNTVLEGTQLETAGAYLIQKGEVEWMQKNLQKKQLQS